MLHMAEVRCVIGILIPSTTSEASLAPAGMLSKSIYTAVSAWYNIQTPQ